jgi:uncharacterized membrane protein YdjX (TVP38/TMEM64 family)
MTLPTALQDLSFLVGFAGNELFLSLAFLAMTTTLIALSVPGVILPLSFSSGALLGGFEGAGVVIAGAVLGSQAFFFAGRRWLGPRIRAKHGARLARIDHHLADRGFFYLCTLRMVGVPHFLVTAAGALSPIGARTFALATAIGFAPAVALAATAGAAI